MKAESFVDTNVFLHFRPLNEIDWLDLLNAEEVVVTICTAVVTELDEKKFSAPLQTLRERAKKSLNLLEQWDGKEIRTNVSVRLLKPEPSLDWQASGLDPLVKDDRILGAALSQALDGYATHIVRIDTGRLPDASSPTIFQSIVPFRLWKKTPPHLVIAA